MQLIKMDTLFGNIPSSIINRFTMGSEGSSLCARLYLYNRYVSDRNVFVNTLISIIDGAEERHCEKSARHWRVRHRKTGCFFPNRYKDFLLLKKV